MIEFDAIVTDVREESRLAGRSRWQLQLDRTEFGEGDLGRLVALARSGVSLIATVFSVTVDGTGEVWHVVEKPLATGTRVQGQVERAKC